MWSRVVLLGLALLPAQALALMLDYGGFYDRMRVVNKNDYPLVTLAFYLNHRGQPGPCQIQSGSLVHKDTRQPVVITPDNEIHLPFDAQLKTDKAVLDLVVEQEAQCDFAMQLRYADPTQAQFAQAELTALVGQFDDVLKRFAGFPFRFLQPDVTGVVIALDQPEGIEVSPAQSLNRDEQGRVVLDADSLSQLESIRFAAPPRWISPYIERD
ncbi:DUF2987 domain-containing protein [Ferrimonas marina]|uniref:DUF2987 domain-containing protein n=1 Tax=Ferrimonas marina TaxID=299255 RepID=A0A1M5NCU5_9GAMM|nr:DUF2987 domain-containing protein [Ferrimonas marina]SHG87009.1 Protein of unknown function [Ferrimonas marina]